MKYISLVTALCCIISSANAQEHSDFHSFAKRQKVQLLHDYRSRSQLAGHAHIAEFLAEYNKLSDKEKGSNKYYLDGFYYLMADIYALNGENEKAMDYLEKSEGYEYSDLVSDNDLDNLRGEPRFRKILESSKNGGSSYQHKLGKSPKYNLAEKNELPPFTYQSKDDANLAELRKTYNLDSVAGKGDDVLQIINLMEWVHYMIPHDGSKGNPKIKNALSMISECKGSHKTLNCRGLAIILNEVYLAEGFKSRFVTCLPRDTTDRDCHVINMVWSASLQKWLWMDPTFMAYVMDEDGNLQSIEEVRERLVNNKPLTLNPDANRNKETRQSKSDYLGSYMSKNLYKLECALDSRYNYETNEEGKGRTYVRLVPGNVKPAPFVSKDKHGMNTYTVLYTNNPKAFWTAPGHDSAGTDSLPVQAYEQLMAKFRYYYNERQADKIPDILSDSWGDYKKSFLDQKKLDDLIKEYGRLISYKYMGRDDGDNDHDVALFRMVFEKSTHAMGISLDKDHKIMNFRFETSSIYIDKMLAKAL